MRWGLWVVALGSIATVVGLSLVMDLKANERPIAAPVIVSLGLAFVGGVSFATFYYREGDRPMRLALTVTFVSMYLLLFTLMIANPRFRHTIEEPFLVAQATAGVAPTVASDDDSEVAATEATARAEPIGVTAFSGFQTIVTTVIGFYFVTQAAESIAAKAKGTKTEERSEAGPPADQGGSGSGDKPAG